MNKVYRIIWSKVRQTYVVVSEIAKREGKTSTSAGSALRMLVASALLFGGVAFTSTSFAEKM